MTDKTINKDKSKEVTANLEEMPGFNYSKKYVSFVIKPLHIDLCHRWSKWCNLHGFAKQHDKAFAFALDILENKVTDLMNADKRLFEIEKLLNAHDKLFEVVLNDLTDIKSSAEEEKTTDDDLTKLRESIRKKREMMGGKKK